MAPIKRTRGRKVLPRPSLKAQARHSVCSGSCNDVVQYRSTRSLSAHGLGYMHRLNFSMILRQAFQRAEPQERLSFQIVQKLMSGDCSALTSNACALPGAVCALALVRWICRRSVTRGSLKSPWMMRIIESGSRSHAIACTPAPEIAALVLHEAGEHHVVHLGSAVHQACLTGIAVNPLENRVL